MPDFKKAIILHATYYLQVADKLNDGYLRGGDEQVSYIKNFDIEFPNFITARDKLIAMIARIDVRRDLSDYDRALLDLCNSFPDAGTYLISVKLNISERISWLKDALKASQQLDNHVTTQAHLGNLGLAYYGLGELGRAVEYFSRALHLAENIDDKYHQGAWLGDLGNTYARMGDHQKAIEFHVRHLGLARENNDIRGEGHALVNLGVSYAFLDNLPRAIENYIFF